MLPLWLRFGLYGCLGWSAEIVWTAITSSERNKELRGHSYLWMFPIYGLLALLYDPFHHLVSHFHLPLRGTLYGACFLLVEYMTAWLLEIALGCVPWDYRRSAPGHRWNVKGYIRLDYLPVWALAGLLLEPVHHAIYVPPMHI